MQSSGQITGVPLLKKSPFEQSVLLFSSWSRKKKEAFVESRLKSPQTERLD